MTEENQKLKSKLQEVKDKDQDQEKKIKALEALQEQFNDLKEDNVFLKQCNKKLQDKLSKENQSQQLNDQAQPKSVDKITASQEDEKLKLQVSELKNQLEQQLNEIKQKESAIEALQEQLIDQKEDNVFLRQSNKKLKDSQNKQTLPQQQSDKVSAKEVDITNAIQENEKLKLQVSELKNQLEQQLNEIKQKESAIEALQEQLIDQKEDNVFLRQSNKKLKDSQNKQTLPQQQSDKVSAKEVDITNAIQENEKLKLQVSELKNQLEQQLNEIKQKESAIEALQEQLIDQKEDNVFLRQSNKKLKDSQNKQTLPQQQSDKVSAKEVDTTNAIQENEKLKLQISDLQHLLQQSVNELKQKENEPNKGKQANEQNSQQNQSQIEKIKKFEGEIKQLQSQNKKQQDEIKDYETKLQQLKVKNQDQFIEKDLNAIQFENQKLKIQSLEKEKQLLCTQIKELQIQLQKKEENEINFESQVKEIEQTINELDEEKNKSQKETEIVKNHNLKLNEKLTLSQQKCKQLEDQIKQQNSGKLSQQVSLIDPPQNSELKLQQIYSRKSLSSYSEEYKHNENIKKVVLELQQKFDSYRSVRGDGNCYFRAVGFSYLEHLARFTTPVQHLQDFINKLESDRGYYQIRPNNKNNSHQILKQTFLRFLNNFQQKKLQNEKQIQQFLVQELQNNKDKQDEALVWQMRCLTANYLESHREYFEPFCQIPYQQIIENVLTMGQEADGLGVGPLQVVLKVKIEIITIDRNYEKALQFDQMKIWGKCPLIYILYKPGHYDIIYSKEQSCVDGFNATSEQFEDKIKLPSQYDIQNPGPPFFIEMTQTNQESPFEEFKPFQIKFVFSYVNIEETARNQKKMIEEKEQKQSQLQKCAVCSTEIEAQSIIALECHHSICKFCFEDYIKQKTGGKIILKQNEGNKKLNCMMCTHELTDVEIETVVGKEKYEKAKKEASQQ